ncbi:MAG: aldo/keto reductase [Candidatus Heimdallarchaeota archaeon]|nr:MAG: aldo/keto reductase [Candidatus Heimdallarchaeota archaeon]
MYTRKLGKSNIEISALGMGCFAIGGPFKGTNGNFLAYGSVNDKESKKTIHKAIELGVNFFDTAEAYGHGHSEEVLGQALKDSRDEIVIATKFRSVYDPKTQTNLEKQDILKKLRKSVNNSLERLQTDYIDIYQLHNARQDSISALIIRDCLEELVDDGKIRYYGWSTDDASRAEQFAKSQHCTALQYVLTVTRINTPIAKLCEENDLAGIIRSPFASGTLTGKYTKDTKRSSDHMLSGTDFGTDRYIRTFQALDQLKDLLQEQGRTLVQGILGYIWAKNDRAIPIPGAKTVNQITENAKTLELGPISQQLMNEIDSIFSELQVDFSYDNFAYYKQDKKD